MNYAEKMERESRLMGRIADWMEAHGRALSDRQRSNAYTGVRIRENDTSNTRGGLCGFPVVLCCPGHRRPLAGTDPLRV